MLATSGPAKKPGVEGELQAPTVAVSFCQAPCQSAKMLSRPIQRRHGSP
jgi:hypothetical protein